MSQDIIKREPIVLIGIVAAGIIALLEAAVVGDLLGVEISGEIIRIIQAVVAIAAIAFGRKKVFSPATYEADVDTALRTPVPEDGDGPTPES